MNQYQPEPCTEDQFIDAQINHQFIEWKRAGNGESFKHSQANGYQNYVRTGNRYWTFFSLGLLNHADLTARVRAVTAQEQEDMREIA